MHNTYIMIMITMLLGILRTEAARQRALDNNDTGADDMIGFALQFAADMVAAIVTGNDIPRPPAVLTDKWKLYPVY